MNSLPTCKVKQSQLENDSVAPIVGPGRFIQLGTLLKDWPVSPATAGASPFTALWFGLQMRNVLTWNALTWTRGAQGFEKPRSKS